MKTKISKKKTYWVTESHTVDCVKSFVVEANNTQEAIDKIKHGEGVLRNGNAGIKFGYQLNEDSIYYGTMVNEDSE